MQRYFGYPQISRFPARRKLADIFERRGGWCSSEKGQSQSRSNFMGKMAKSAGPWKSVTVRRGLPAADRLIRRPLNSPERRRVAMENCFGELFGKLSGDSSSHLARSKVPRAHAWVCDYSNPGRAYRPYKSFACEPIYVWGNEDVSVRYRDAPLDDNAGW